MNKIIIHENQRGFLFHNGKYVKVLTPGRYFTFGGREITVSDFDQPIVCFKCTLQTLLADQYVAAHTSCVEVGDRQLALHYVNGKFGSVLLSGKHAFWNFSDQHEFVMVDTSTPEVDESIPTYVFSKIPQSLYTKIEVAEYQKARLYFDKKLVRLLDAGTHYFWNTPVKVSADFVDTRLLQMDVTGQEMLSADKVTLRINFVCSYRVTDFVRILTEIDDYAEQLHVAAQLALRDYVGKHKLDEILENKEQMSAFVYDRLAAKEQELYVKIEQAGVKDIILPGEIREIMNTVLVAEKRAQANVIMRREEVASTRSLLNTAKMMDENKTLYKLKELEYVERICENVGNITLNGSGDILSQLTAVLRS